MRKMHTLLLTLALLLLQNQTLAGPTIHTWHTQGGAKVLFVEAPELPMLDIRIVFDAGSARDPDLPGLARITNGLLADGAGELSADAIAERFDSVGANLGLGSLRDMAWVSLRTLTEPQALNTSLETLATLIGAPTFGEEDIERNRQQMLAALRHDAQNPGRVAKMRFLAELFADHPYGHHDGGTEASLKRIEREAIKAFYRRHYVAANAVIALVGKIDRAQAERIAEQLVAGLARGEAAPPLPAVSPRTRAAKIAIPFPSTQSHIYIGQPGLYRGDPDYFTLYVGNHILGGSGLVSRLSDEVREKRGLSYSVYSYFSPMRRHGPFIMGAQTKNASTEEALKVMLDTLQRFIEKGPEAEELQEAKQNITGSYPIRIAGNHNIVEYLGMIGFYGLSTHYLDEFAGKIEAVTLEQIRETFQRRIDPETLLTVTAGNPD